MLLYKQDLLKQNDLTDVFTIYLEQTERDNDELTLVIQ
jgi:hypothetical protein